METEQQKIISDRLEFNCQEVPGLYEVAEKDNDRTIGYVGVFCGKVTFYPRFGYAYQLETLTVIQQQCQKLYNEHLAEHEHEDPGFETHKLDQEAFQAKLNTVVRFWNDIKEVGQADNQASQELKDACRYIFVRDDGWSIASPEYEGAYNLWPDEWACCYVLEGQRKTHDHKDFTIT